VILLRNIGRLFTAGERGTIEQAAVAIDGERIAWAGPSAEAPRVPYDEVDCGGRLVTPGLIDAHTHPLYAGSRCAEIGARSAGASYLEIAQAGGGIGATVRATRDASFEALGQAASDRLASWLAGGTPPSRPRPATTSTALVKSRPFEPSPDSTSRAWK